LPAWLSVAAGRPARQNQRRGHTDDSDRTVAKLAAISNTGMATGSTAVHIDAFSTDAPPSHR
jgi:hypothetical protein